MWKTRTTDNLTILQRTGYTTFKELAGDFYSEAATHLPFVLPIHNLWRAKKLNDINYGKRTFRMKDSAEVEKIFSDAGKGSAAESTYEAGPQSVTQVPKKVQLLLIISTGADRTQYRTIHQDADNLCDHLSAVPLMGGSTLLPHHADGGQGRPGPRLHNGHHPHLATLSGLRAQN